jgi:tricorn protease
VKKKYEPYLAGLGSRSDLDYLFDEMLGEITIGHMFVRGPTLTRPFAEGGLAWGGLFD